ncbi:DEAD/DEAH box helicase [Desertimonas flava]|uniref:DEAD/DEAH box helicase n=1 Tax=Desertimonas flava TaxID=2064846 RepID=UPI000E34CF1E|nr:DEAD/DEAH box helicase [Desertimonas flava]
MTSPVSGFAELGLPSDFCARLTASGIDAPFPIQAAVIADALAGRDVCGRAPTGSGKTLAFGLPVVAGLSSASNRRPTALILAPTRELVDQIANELRPYVRLRNHAVATVYGGVGYGPQRKALADGAELVVACPGRLEDLIASGDIRLDRVEQVVLDEADRMADMGFLPSVRRILGLITGPRQVHLFSATMNNAVTKLIAEVQTDPVNHAVGSDRPDVSAATHVFWNVARADRAAVAAAAIESMGSTIVFCRTRHGADRLARQLNRAGTTAAAIHGGRSQPQRDRALRAFTKGDVTTLVATDVAARGVHVDDVAGVVHFDLPADGETYIHRSGRTARAGARGTVVAFVDPADRRDALALQRSVGISVSVSDVDHSHLEAPAAPPAAPVPTVTAEPRAVDQQRPVVASTRQTGTVRSYNGARGYGFIDAGTNESLFVHRSHLPAGKRLRSGQRVEFEIRPGQKGLEAIDVRLVPA